ncbi:MAG: hypothetical protein Q4G13_02390 [Moraxella sp.]|nr:hypothetical protein [Moraxella sp.]
MQQIKPLIQTKLSTRTPLMAKFGVSELGALGFGVLGLGILGLCVLMTGCEEHVEPADSTNHANITQDDTYQIGAAYPNGAYATDTYSANKRVMVDYSTQHDKMQNTVQNTAQNTTADTATLGATSNLAKLSNGHNCPRLLQQQVDNTMIAVESVLFSPYCDYFLYPVQGQMIDVSLKNRLLKVELLRPMWHDFANGAYTVTQSGRHVIRVRYDGVQKQPKNIDYTVVVHVD